MLKLSRRTALQAATIAATAGLPKLSMAQAPTYEPLGAYTPTDLGGTLTPLGGIKAGNADGSIPAWDGGGCSSVPASYQNGDILPTIYTDEKPVLIINSENMAQYANKLSAGQQAILQKYPDFNLQVFPTHRTAIAPQYVYDYTAKNAKNAQLTDGGDGIIGAYGGVPFPIPTNGYEVMWNHILAFKGVTCQYSGGAYTITASGQLVLETSSHDTIQYPYYIQNGETNWDGIFEKFVVVPYAPPYEAGGSILQWLPTNPVKTDVEAWVYLVGQRRVRRAPELQYDTPNSLAGGTSNWDEQLIFSGKFIEYDMKFLGVKEVYVPYNSNKFCGAMPEEQYLPHFVNPDLVRWELHRCRVVEMTVKPGVRNVDVRRLVYCDEDTGSALLGEVYDANGSLWKFQYIVALFHPGVPAVQALQNFMTYELHAGDYSAGNVTSKNTLPQWKVIPQIPDSFFTPGRLAAMSGSF